MPQAWHVSQCKGDSRKKTGWLWQMGSGSVDSATRPVKKAVWFYGGMVCHAGRHRALPPVRPRSESVAMECSAQRLARAPAFVKYVKRSGRREMRRQICAWGSGRQKVVEADSARAAPRDGEAIALEVESPPTARPLPPCTPARKKRDIAGPSPTKMAVKAANTPTACTACRVPPPELRCVRR